MISYERLFAMPAIFLVIGWWIQAGMMRDFQRLTLDANAAAAVVEIENHGVTPTIAVSMPPGCKGDPQVRPRGLERSVRLFCT